MNASNFLYHFRRVKNAPAAGNLERLLSLFDFDEGSEVRLGALVEQLNFAGAQFQPFTGQLPAGSRVLFAGFYVESLTGVSLNTATRIALGTATTPAAFYLSAALGSPIPAGTTDIQPVADTNARVSAATTPRLGAVDNSGLATGIASGTVKCVLIYTYCLLPKA